VRVTTRQARFVLRGVRADAGGLHWSTLVDRGTLDSLNAPGTLAWSEVVGLERFASRARSGAKRGAIWLGGLAALGVGLAAAADGADINSVGAAFFGGVLGAGVGAAVGGLVGATGPGWQRVYPLERTMSGGPLPVQWPMPPPNSALRTPPGVPSAGVCVRKTNGRRGAW
jgi:hypothetical protein